MKDFIDVNDITTVVDKQNYHTFYYNCNENPIVLHYLGQFNKQTNIDFYGKPIPQMCNFFTFGQIATNLPEVFYILVKDENFDAFCNYFALDRPFNPLFCVK